MNKPKSRYFNEQFEGLAHEISVLLIACDIDLGTPELPERILRNDAGVCGRQNPQAFEKLRHHLMALYPLEERSIERLGAEETKRMLDVIRQSIVHLRELGHTGRAPESGS
jgi:hypothetical protein